MFEKDNPLVDCANQAIGALQADDRLAAIESQWLADYTGAPLISEPG